MTTPLDGILVLDLSRVLSGPYCTMQLADLGARVIKVERPDTGDETRAWGPPFVGGESAYFLSVNSNKESVSLDLKHPGAKAVIEKLMARADVLVENFRPGTMARLGLGYEQIAAAHPRLIYCSISGFGQTGPRSAEAGYDAVIQAEGGLMSITGAEDGPPYRLGVAIADIATGMFAAQAVLAALVARERSGQGQRVDVAMLDSVAALLTYQAGIFFATGTTPPRMGNRHPTIVPYETFPAADGEFVIAVGNDGQFARLCEAIGAPELSDDPRFATNPARVRDYAALKGLLDARLSRRTRADWVRALKAAGVPCGSVRSVGETLTDPQLTSRGMIVPLTHPSAGDIRVLGSPLKFSATPARIDAAPPTLGQHTDAVLLKDAGLTEVEIAGLRRAGVI